MADLGSVQAPSRQGEATAARLRLPRLPASLGLPWNSLVPPAMHPAGSQRAESLWSAQQEKDAELDRRIAALRKKNQALLRRYQEIQEDQRLAEQGVNAGPPTQELQSDGLTVTVSQGKRVVSRNWVRRPPGPGMAADGLEEEEETAGTAGAFWSGQRVELAVTMENKAQAKRMVSEKPPRVRNQGQSPSTQTAGSAAPALKAAREPRGPGQGAGTGARWGPPEVGWDYAQWKQERERIDQARLARHRDVQGEWRRPWDLDKTVPMPEHFGRPREGPARAGSSDGPRSPRKGQPSLSPPGGKGGSPQGGQASRTSGAPAPRNKASGMERLTGRARRWDMKEDKEPRSQEGGRSNRSPGREKAKPREQGRPTGLEPGPEPESTASPGSPARAPSIASLEGPVVSATSPATAGPLSPPHSDLAPLDLSLGGARRAGSRESRSEPDPKLGAQETPGSWPEGSEPSPGWRGAQAGPETQRCSASSRGSGPPEAREDSRAEAQQGLAPRNRPRRGPGPRTRGAEEAA